MNAWDLQISAPGGLGSEPQSFTITLPDFDLDPDHFNFTDNRGGKLFAGVSIGHYGTQPGEAGNDFITVGAAVPEPATILLLGVGLFCLAGLKKMVRK